MNDAQEARLDRDGLLARLDARKRQIGWIVSFLRTDPEILGRGIYDALPEGEGAKTWEDADEDTRAFMVEIATACLAQFEAHVRRGGSPDKALAEWDRLRAAERHLDAILTASVERWADMSEAIAAAREAMKGVTG